jgi:putative ABC transport system permease protein
MSWLISAINMAWLNLWRNSRRSLVTIFSLAFGFAAIAIFAGYTNASYTILANSAIHFESTGHLTINRNGWLTQGKLHPGRYMLTKQELAQIKAMVAKALPGAIVIPRVFTTGLISNGKISTTFMAMGIAPSDQMILRGPFRDSPGLLSHAKPTGVTLAEGLADTLGLKLGDEASIFTSTVSGQANALDVDVTGLTNTGHAVTNDRLLIMPLALSQDLIDTPERAAMVTVLLPIATLPPQKMDQKARLLLAYTLKSPSEAESALMKRTLEQSFKSAGLNFQVRTWQEMSAFYRQVSALYDIIFAVMLSVVMTIVVLSIFNAMSMAVIERTREIGTLRAIGLRRSKVIGLFIIEALLLILLGVMVGLVLTTIVRYGVNAADIQYNAPSTTTWVPLYIGFDWAKTSLAALILAALALLAALLPARRAASNAIIDSLAHT